MNKFRNISIRYKLFMSYGLVLLLVTFSGIFLLISIFESNLENSIERELHNSTKSILTIVKSTVDASIKNRLRGVAEKNREIVAYYYGLYRNGTISEAEAKKRAGKILLSQQIGETGYFYVLGTAGHIIIHPKKELLKSDLSKYRHIRRQLLVREGYLEYEWANPGEKKMRPKAVYMVYFEPWNWIISASTYREEFIKLIDTSDFRDSVLSQTFGKTGYSFIIDMNGKLIIHRELEGTNIIQSRDATGRMFIKELIERKNGKIIYPWKNPSDETARQKLVIFNHIPELAWIVASSSYLEEFYSPLERGYYVGIGVLVITLVFITVISVVVGGKITKPMRELKQRFEEWETRDGGDFSFRVNVSSHDEMGELALYFNSFMQKLEIFSKRIRDSESRYRSIIERAVEGIFQTTPSGLFLNVSPSMAKMLGYSSQDELVSTVRNIGSELYVDADERKRFMHLLTTQEEVKGFELRMKRRDGSVIWVSLNARGVLNDEGKLLYIEGFMSDISERKAAEDRLRRTNEELEKRVGERTEALSDWIAKLEQRNLEQSLIQKLSEKLQVCETVEETYGFISYFGAKLFPGSSGVFFLYRENEQIYEPVAFWGREMENSPFIRENDCWAVREGKTYRVWASSVTPRCAHVSDGYRGTYLCNPVSAQGKQLGIIHLRFGDDGGDLLRENSSVEEPLSIFSDHLALVLANVKLREALRRQSFSDVLTGLHNRRYMEEFLKREDARISRQGGTIAFVMLDVDHFKRINDNYGHDVGDEVLKKVGFFLKRMFRENDIVCRYGGEEFLVVMPDSSHEKAMAKAEVLCRQFPEYVYHIHDGEKISLTGSFGVASYPEHGMNTADVISHADEAMYRAKRSGRNRVTGYGEDENIEQ